MTHYSIIQNFTYTTTGFNPVGQFLFQAKPKITVLRMAISATLFITVVPAANPNEVLRARCYLNNTGNVPLSGVLPGYLPTGTLIKNEGSPFATSDVPFEGCLDISTDGRLFIFAAFEPLPGGLVPAAADTIRFMFELTIGQ